MKKVCCVLFFCLLADISFGGCTSPMFKTSFGVSSDYRGYGTYTVYAFPNDSFDLTIMRGHCHWLGSAHISFYNNTIRTYDPTTGYDFFVKLPCTPGIYDLFAEDEFTEKFHWTITLIAKIAVLDSTTVDTAGAVSQTTSLSSVKILNPDFLLYPNPAHDLLTLSNESDAIRTVSFYDVAGQLLSKYEIYNTKTIINLDKYAPGIYQVSVATLSDKIIIRRISIL